MKTKLLILAILLTGCGKSELEKCSTGKFAFDNGSNKDYIIQVSNGVKVTAPKLIKTEVTLTPSKYFFEVYTPLTGGYLYAIADTFEIKGCETMLLLR